MVGWVFGTLRFGSAGFCGALGGATRCTTSETHATAVPITVLSAEDAVLKLTTDAIFY